jgi:F-type H+-transporting ATPase subunit a
MITVTYLGIKKHHFKFIYLFIPSGVPKFLIFYILIIEFISYLSRVLSLSIRLTTNMIAGHVLIYILSFFAYQLHFTGIFLLPPLIAIFILEIGVSIIQAYVLSVLISTYIKDSLELNH